jgi:hypothetical protein
MAVECVQKLLAVNSVDIRIVTFIERFQLRLIEMALFDVEHGLRSLVLQDILPILFRYNTGFHCSA